MGDLELTTGRVDSHGESIYWEFASLGAEDDRPVVVLSHGAGGTHAIWYQQVPALGAHYRVVTWDSRGFGNSTNRNNEPNPDSAAGDLAAVLDELGIQQAHLVGQSMGGWHISAFATANPGRALSLAYADTVGGLWTDELREAMAGFNAGGGVSSFAQALVGGHPALWPGTGEADQAHAFLYQALGSFHSPPMDQLGATIQWTVSHDDVSALGVPVLFIAGSHDQIFPPAPLANSCALIPGSRFAEIPASGHSPYFEQPAAWNDALLSFLSAST